MTGINLDKPITYIHSSMRFFNKNEHHVTRFCSDDVLLLVYSGILRFNQNGESYEIYPGEYFIQKAGTFQDGPIASDSPKYLYVHFKGEWDENEHVLDYKGKFEYSELRIFMERLDNISHNSATLTEKSGVFYEILTLLKKGSHPKKQSDIITEYIKTHLADNITLSQLANEFHFSKNQIINIFKKDYGITPFQYINNLKINQAERLLESTSQTAENIAEKCGFDNYSHFYKTFYKKNKVSPTKWRNQRRVKSGF